MAVEKLKTVRCFPCDDGIGESDVGQYATQGVGLCGWVSAPVSGTQPGLILTLMRW